MNFPPQIYMFAGIQINWSEKFTTLKETPPLSVIGKDKANEKHGRSLET
jgi:hypothetical protein